MLKYNFLTNYWFSAYISVFQHLTSVAIAHTHTHTLLALPHSLYLSKLERAKHTVRPVDPAAAADFCHCSLGVSWGCVSERANFICFVCRDCVCAYGYIYIYIDICVLMGAFTVYRQHYKSNFNSSSYT